MRYLFIVFAVLTRLVSQGQVQLSADQWKAVEGIYQNTRNPDMNIRFEGHGDTLVGYPLWVGKASVRLLPQSPLEFHGIGTGEGGNFRVVFKPDSSRSVNQVLINGDPIWVRNNHYQPLIRKPIERTADQLQPFGGYYELRSGTVLRIFVRDNHLILKQLWDGNELEFTAESDSSFFLPNNLLFSLVFSKDDAGRVTKMVAFKTDHWKRLDRVTFTQTTLRQYEGKYQSKDDPDNQVSVVAKDSLLVVKQAWDGKETAFGAISGTFFFNDAASSSLEFVPEANGKIKEMRLYGNNVFIPVDH